MPDFPKDLLLDVPPYPPAAVAGLADRLGALLSTSADLLIVQGEAIVALEAVATSLAHPGISALVVVTSPYGRRFGAWLRRGGAKVTEVVAAPGMPVPPGTVERALARHPSTDLVSLAHAESASGILNPLAEIAGLARRHGAAVVVDAVASVGGHALDLDRLGVDIAVIGPQKALGGSPGLSVVSVSRRAWALLDRGDAPLGSALSLLDLKRDWLDSGRMSLPGMPSALELFALEAALDRIEAEGIDRVIARHALAAASARRGVRALGLAPFVEDRFASNLVTAVKLPDGVETDAVLAFPGAIDAGLSAGAGDDPARLVRMSHTGMRASRDDVLAAVLTLGKALRSLGLELDLEAASAAVVASFDGADRRGIRAGHGASRPG
jgi:aspartate aminotransferase-like enzyme